MLKHAMTSAKIFPELEELDDDKQKFLVWYAKTKAMGRWFSAEEMRQLRLRHRDEGAVADTDFESLTSRAFDSMYKIDGSQTDEQICSTSTVLKSVLQSVPASRSSAVIQKMLFKREE